MTGGTGAESERWSVVTGAASGIGREIADMLGADGPVLGIDLQAPAGSEARGPIQWATADIASPEAVDAAFRALPEAARIRCLVNCAGIFDHAPAETMSLSSWERVIAVNLTGAFLCSRAAFPRMGRGSVIVNIGSINGHRAIPTHANYAVSKAGLSMLTRCLAVEWGRHGIRVVCLSPGIVDTPMNRRVEEQAGIDPRAVQRTIPLGRYATPGEIARIVRFLASDDAGFVSGADLLADGAWSVSGL